MELIEKIIELGNSPLAPVKYELVNGNSLRMAGHSMPWSVSAKEMTRIYDTIIKYNLKHGFELATGFGVSAIAAGLAFKQTGGRLVTMDSYAEEHYDNCGGYGDKQEVFQNSDGINSIRYLVETFGLQETVLPFIGWSPRDSRQFVEQIHTRLDYVFIDGYHTDAAVIADIEAIRPCLATKFVLFLHDVHCFGATVVDYLEKNFGRSWTTFEDCIHIGEGGGFNLSHINKFEEKDMAHWNYRLCKFKTPEGSEKIGIFEVYYDEKKVPFARAKNPELSWFVEKCEALPATPEQAAREAAWDVKSMVKAFRAPMMDAEKDF